MKYVLVTLALLSVVNSAFAANATLVNAATPETRIDIGTPDIVYEGETKADWWDYDWQYRRAITIDNTGNPDTLIDYPVYLDLTFDSDMNANFVDIRFTDDNSGISYPYYIYSYTASSQADVYINVPGIPGSSTVTIYIYYGNPSTTSESDIYAYLEFYDDFSSDPNSNGLWNVYRYADDSDNEGWWNSASRNFYLTVTGQRDRGCTIIANYPLEITDWYSTFDYYIGDGNGADGLSTMFYKDESRYSTVGPSKGGGLGFVTSGSGNTSIEGYGVEFDGWKNSWDSSNNHIAIIEDHVNTHLARVNDSRTEDATWHTVEVEYLKGYISITIDGEATPLLEYTISSPDYSYTGFGFGAGAGDLYNSHIIDNVTLRKYTDPEPTTSIGSEEDQPVDVKSTSLGEIKAAFK